jgi:predicted permease
VYSLLLHLYPRSFRHEYGEEMRALVARRRRDVGGFPAPVLFWARLVAETATDAAAVHLDLLRQDLRHASRSLGRARGFSMAVIAVTGLGIGVTTAAVSIADHVLVRPLPFHEPDRLVKLWQDQSFRGYSRMELSPGNYRDWKEQARSFTGMSAFTGASTNLTGTSQPERLDGAQVTTDLFETLGVHAALGRTFVPADATGPRPVLLSDALWRSLFGADPSVLGRTVVLDETRHTIVGVMPPSFNFPTRDTEFWTPLVFDPEAYEDRGNVFLRVVARLAPGVSADAARAELNVIAASLAKAFPEANAKTGATVVTMRDEVGRQSRSMVYVIAGASVCLLLLACTNLASLVVARAVQRHRELSVRVAMGAGAERLIRQQLTESLLLSIAGGVLGVAIAVSAVPLLAQLVPTALPIAELPGVDIRMLSLVAVLTVGTGVGFSLLPSMRLSRASGLDALRDSARTGPSRSTERVRAAMVVTQVAISVVLLVASGLLVHALWRVQQVYPGFESAGVLTMRTGLAMPAYRSAARREAFFNRVLDETRAMPGVAGAAYISYLPMVMRGGVWSVTPEGAAADSAERRTASMRLVTPGFFETLRIPLRSGRDFAAGDARDSSVPPVAGQPIPTAAIVSESFAREFLGGAEALGRRFAIAFYDATIVGVVGDVRVRGLERTSEPQVYLPSAMVPDGALTFYTPRDLVIRSTGSFETLVPAVRAAIRRADPQQPVSDIRPLADIVSAETAPRRSQLAVLVGYAAAAVMLAAVGLHGLLAFVVSSRTREIGVRLALGAPPNSILALVLGRGALLAGAGVAAGVMLAYAAGLGLQALLAGVSPSDPASFAAAAAVAFATAIAGSAWPALRAARVDPAAATRAE